jgi:hypothetical protein
MRVLAHIDISSGDGGLQVVTADEIPVMTITPQGMTRYMDAIGSEDYEQLTDVVSTRIYDTLKVIEHNRLVAAVRQAVSPGPAFDKPIEFAIHLEDVIIRAHDYEQAEDAIAGMVCWEVSDVPETEQIDKLLRLGGRHTYYWNNGSDMYNLVFFRDPPPHSRKADKLCEVRFGRV